MKIKLQKKRTVTIFVVLGQGTLDFKGDVSTLKYTIMILIYLLN